MRPRFGPGTPASSGRWAEGLRASERRTCLPLPFPHSPGPACGNQEAPGLPCPTLPGHTHLPRTLLVVAATDHGGGEPPDTLAQHGAAGSSARSVGVEGGINDRTTTLLFLHDLALPLRRPKGKTGTIAGTSGNAMHG